QASGIYDFAADSSIALGNRSPTLTNAGKIEKTAGSGTSSIQIGFSNTDGTLEVDSGTLSLATAGGTSTRGTFQVGQGATLDFTGGPNANLLTGAYTGSGAGQVTLAGGDIVIGSGGATFNFPAGFFLLTNGSLNLAGNNLTNAGSLTLANTSAVGIFA